MRSWHLRRAREGLIVGGKGRQFRKLAVWRPNKSSLDQEHRRDDAVDWDVRIVSTGEAGEQSVVELAGEVSVTYPFVFDSGQPSAPASP